MNKTTIKVSKETSLDLLITAKLNGKSKEEFTELIIRDGLKPYLNSIERKKFS